jgi:hypothetical protein
MYKLSNMPAITSKTGINVSNDMCSFLVFETTLINASEGT